MLLDFESAVLFPLLCDKTGLNNNILKDKVKKLVRMTYNIYDKHKIYTMLITYGLNSKNLRAVSESLDEFTEFIKNFGLDYTSEKDLKLVAKMADSNDKGIRENAVSAMGEIYRNLGDDIWRLVGDVTPKVQGLLE
jgi:cytoskeleton-associated protein 5